MTTTIQNLLRIATRLWPVKHASGLTMHARMRAKIGTGLRASLLAFACGVIGAVEVQGQILTFEFSALAGDEATAGSSSNNANLNSSTISRGAGLSASANAQRFNATSWAVNSIADAVSGNDYMEFTITPNAGYQFSVSSIVVQWQRSATGNSAISLRSSVDSYATDLDAVKSVTDSTSTQTFTWTFTQANSNAPVTYRFYSYAEATGGTGGPGDGSGNDIVVNGTVTTATPTISQTGTAAALATTSGTASASTSVGVTGTNLTADITATAPGGFEVSSNDSSWAGTATFSQSGGNASGTLYVRLAAGTAVGDYGGIVTLASTGASNVNVAVEGTVDLPAPTANAASATNATGFTAAWGTVSGADGYELDVSTNANFGSYAVEEDFTDGDFTSSPVWSGDTNGYEILTDATLPNGNASTDGSFIGSVASTNYVILTTPSTEVSEWRFAFGSPNFDPSGANHFGVILMSDTAVTGDITSANFQGYYIRLGVNTTPDYLELWRKTGAGNDKVGDFSAVGAFTTGALKGGLDIRVTRNASGEFELFHAEGFSYASTPGVSGGVLTNNVYDSSSFFGVYARFGNPDPSRRVYIDNIVLGTDEPDFVSAYQSRPIAGGGTTSAAVTGLVSSTEYFYRVRATNDSSTSGNSTTQGVTTLASTVLKLEPSNHATDFRATLITHRTIVLAWTDAGGSDLPDAYIVRGSTNSYADIPVPVDNATVGSSFTWSDGRYARRVAQGTQLDEVSGANSYGLIPGHTYYFKLFPVANSDTLSNYKTNGVVPEIAVTTLTDVPFEDFESGVTYGGKTTYATGNVTLKSGDWELNEVLLNSDDGDKKHDQRALRFRNLGVATMLSLVTDVETMTLEHANYTGDTGGKFKVERSIDGGGSWQQLGSEVTCGTTLQTATFTVHRLAAFRLRICKTSVADDSRINIDNIRFTPFEHEGSVFRFR